MLTVLGKRLSDAGYSVIKSESSENAIVMAKNEHPDLIILDIIMPAMDGAKTAETLKNDPAAKDIPTIFLTYLLTKEGEKEGHIIGGRYFIAKPYNPKEMLEVISSHI